MKTPVRVCSFESRRCDEMERLIEKSGGVATVAPSMQEVPLDSHTEALEFGDKLFRGEIDSVVFMTGVGAKALWSALETEYSAERIREQFSNCLLIARGPKPVVALKEYGLKMDLKAPEPNTWKELAQVIAESDFELRGKTIAVQEYGVPSTELYEWLESEEAKVLPVPIYRWELPDDIAPLKAAVQATIDGEFDLLMWTSAQQVNHVLEVAEEMGVRAEWLDAARQCVIASIGPTATERLKEFGLPPAMEPSHPKMAHLVRESITLVIEKSDSD